MKKFALLILILIFISGCQTHEPISSVDNLPQAKPKLVPANKTSTNAIYNRYKNKNHRYTIHQDRAPSKNTQVNFKEPIPISEPLSRYGNPSEYHVDGKNYEVLTSSTGYKTRGIASWYGMKFHKQRTSSGEPYNMYVMTAAHKTLPLPTYIKVKNLSNGREAIVKVNDRGPFHSDRVIDLSYAAALKLGIFPKGTAPVEIETIKGPSSQGHYYLQAGAFSSQVLANQLREQLSHITPSPVFIEQYNQKYIVRVGPFAERAMSNQLKSKLTRIGITGSFSVLI